MAGNRFQCRTVRGIQLLAIDEDLFTDAQHAQPAQTNQLVALLKGIINLVSLIRRLRRRHVQLVAGLANKLAKPLSEMFRLVDQIQHHTAQLVQLCWQNICRMFARRHIRIAVAIAAQLALQNIVGKAADHLATARCAEPNRVVERVFQGVTLMREPRRNVENIAWLQLFINNPFERIHLKQVRMRTVLFHRHFLAHAPAAATRTLNNKHVVLVQVRTHAATRNGEGDHQIVHPPVGQGAERAH